MAERSHEGPPDDETDEGVPLAAAVSLAEAVPESEDGAAAGVHQLTVPASARGTRLDRYLAQALADTGLTRSRLQALIEEQHVTVGKDLGKASQKLKGGESVRVNVPPPRPSTLIPEDIPLEILYEDADLVVLVKPPGMVVHPAHGAWQGTLVHALLHAVEDLSGVGGEERPGIVHRLDKDTSGVLVVAKTDRAHQGLGEQFRVHSIRREYQALVRGVPPEQGTWRSNLGRSPHNRLKMASLAQGGRHAVTHFRRLEVLPGASLMQFTLETGRTHQLRVHSSEAGFPILCDDVYGGHWARGLAETSEVRLALEAAGRQLLHARVLGFVHPDGRSLCFEAPLPEDFARVLDALRAARLPEYPI